MSTPTFHEELMELNEVLDAADPYPVGFEWRDALAVLRSEDRQTKRRVYVKKITGERFEYTSNPSLVIVEEKT